MTGWAIHVRAFAIVKRIIDVESTHPLSGTSANPSIPTEGERPPSPVPRLQVRATVDFLFGLLDYLIFARGPSTRGLAKCPAYIARLPFIALPIGILCRLP